MGISGIRKTSTVHGAPEDRRVAPGTSRLGELRGAFFGQAAESATRYGMSFDDLVKHLWRVRCGRGRVRLRTVRHLDDLVHAVACLDDVSQAWSDLIDRYESVLVRRCTVRLGEMRAILLARRTLAGLRQAARATDGQDGLALYAGERPLRSWLASRAISQLRPQPSIWCVGRPGGPAIPHTDSTPQFAEAISFPFPDVASGTA